MDWNNMSLVVTSLKSRFDKFWCMNVFVYDYRPIHLLPKVKCNSYIRPIKCWKVSAGNYSAAGKRDHWPASEDTSLPYLTLIIMLSLTGVVGDWLWSEPERHW